MKGRRHMTDPIANSIRQTTEGLGPRRPRVSDLTIDRLCWAASAVLIGLFLTAPRWWPQ